MDYGGCNCGNDRSDSETCDTTDSIDISFLEDATLSEVRAFLEENIYLNAGQIEQLLYIASPNDIEATLETRGITPSVASIIASMIIGLRTDRRSSFVVPSKIIEGVPSEKRPRPGDLFIDPEVANNTYRLKGAFEQIFPASKSRQNYDLPETLPRPLAGSAATMGPPSSSCEQKAGVTSIINWNHTLILLHFCLKVKH